MATFRTSRCQMRPSFQMLWKKVLLLKTLKKNQAHERVHQEEF